MRVSFQAERGTLLLKSWIRLLASEITCVKRSLGAACQYLCLVQMRNPSAARPNRHCAGPQFESRWGVRLPKTRMARSRSEEHTSELQSLTNLVCRLLLEKKKKKKKI